MNILVAPNAFKNSLDAQDVAGAIAEGLHQSKLDCTCRLFPVGDGGDGTADLLIKHLNGKVFYAPVHDALDRPIKASFGLIDNGKTAIIEMANTSGIRLLRPDELDPLRANTIGMGELIIAALNKGVERVIVGMGGSATIDGGTGILSALGIKFLNTNGDVLTDLPSSLIELDAIDASDLDKRILNCEIIILCDVENKLLGTEGAAAVFGPQKGASPADVLLLDKILSQFSAIVLQQTGKDMSAIKHSGTAGGAAAGMYAFLNAKLVSGADYFLKLTNFDIALNNTDLLITGEGSIDEQTLQGKAPAAVAAIAKQKGIKVIGLAGQVQTDTDALYQYFDQLLSINQEPANLTSALQNARFNLIRTAKELGDRLA
jgi:glycerate kinase